MKLLKLRHILWIVDHVCLFIELCGLKPNIYNKSTKESAVGCPTRSAYAQHKRYDSSVWLMCHTFWRRIMPTRVEERDSHVAKRHKINRVVRHAETTYTIALDDTIAKGMTHGCMTHSGDSSRGWIITERNTFNFLLLQFRSDQWSSSIGRRTPFRNPSLPDKSRVLCHFCSLIFSYHFANSKVIRVSTRYKTAFEFAWIHQPGATYQNSATCGQIILASSAILYRFEKRMTLLYLPLIWRWFR